MDPGAAEMTRRARGPPPWLDAADRAVWQELRFAIRPDTNRREFAFGFLLLVEAVRTYRELRDACPAAPDVKRFARLVRGALAEWGVRPRDCQRVLDGLPRHVVRTVPRRRVAGGPR